MTPYPTSPDTPGSSSRVRVEGTLDLVRVSDSSFTFVLPDGRTVPGRLFGPAGELEGIDANGFMPIDGQPWVISATGLVRNATVLTTDRDFDHLHDPHPTRPWRVDREWVDPASKPTP